MSESDDTWEEVLHVGEFAGEWEYSKLSRNASGQFKIEWGRVTLDGEKIPRRVDLGSYLALCDVFDSAGKVDFNSPRLSKETTTREVDRESAVEWLKARCQEPDQVRFNYYLKKLDGG